MATQNIDFPEIPNLKIGVSEPVLLIGNTETGIRLQYSIVSGGEFADLIDGIQINPKAVGTVQIQALAPADQGFDESIVTQDIVIEEGLYYERTEAINRARAKLDSDLIDLDALARSSIADVQILSFNVLQNAVEISLNGENFTIDYKRFAMKFINSAIAFWESEITAEETRLASMRNDLKTIDP